MLSNESISKYSKIWSRNKNILQYILNYGENMQKKYNIEVK